VHTKKSQLNEPIQKLKHTSADELVRYAIELCEYMASKGVAFRLFGSCAIRIKCGKELYILDNCNRLPPKDIDGIIHHENWNRFRFLLLDRGWEDNVELMVQTDGQRLQFRDPKLDVLLEVCVDALKYAQTLDVRQRLESDFPTLPAADLLLSKLQIPELTSADLIDVMALIHAIPIGNSDKCEINVARLIDITSKSWKWYKSVTMSLRFIKQIIDDETLCQLTDTDRDHISSQLSTIENAILSSRKTTSWRLRALIGDALPWKNRVEPT
jgi:hypothetical protein